MRRERAGAPDLILIGAVATLCGIGLTMILSASSATAASYATMAYFWQQQCLWLALGFGCAFAAYHVPAPFLKSVAPWLALVAVAGLLLTFVPHVGMPVNGAHRWLHAGRLSLQPSEFAKLALVLSLSAWLGKRSSKRLGLAAVLRGLVPTLAMVLLVLMEPDLGTAAILAIIMLAVLFIAGVRMWNLLLLSTAAVAGAAFAILRHSAWMTRLTVFMNPWRDPQNTGFHVIQSLYALGSGGWSGVGLGASHEKFFYLPEQYTDFIFSVLGEELGLVGTICVVALFLLVAYRAYRIALRAPDRFGRVLVIGCATMIVVQAFVNIGVVTSSLPVAGVPLPFISFGGSSLVADLIAVALILNVGRVHLAESVIARHRRFRVAVRASVPAFEPVSQRFESLWEIERAILDASYAFETSVHAPSEAYDAWSCARNAASRFGEVFQAHCMQLPEHVTQELVKLHRRFTEIFQAYFNCLVASNGDTRIAFSRARANGDLVLGDISRCLEVVENAMRGESGCVDAAVREERPHLLPELAVVNRVTRGEEARERRSPKSRLRIPRNRVGAKRTLA